MSDFYSNIVPEYHLQVSDQGILYIVYFNRLVAIIVLDGLLMWKDPDVPMYLIEYLILQPRPETTQWN